MLFFIWQLYNNKKWLTVNLKWTYFMFTLCKNKQIKNTVNVYCFNFKVLYAVANWQYVGGNLIWNRGWFEIKLRKHALIKFNDKDALKLFGQFFINQISHSSNFEIFTTLLMWKFWKNKMLVLTNSIGNLATTKHEFRRNCFLIVMKIEKNVKNDFVWN